jgi:hypothetical protein
MPKGSVMKELTEEEKEAKAEKRRAQARLRRMRKKPFRFLDLPDGEFRAPN